MTNQEFNIAFKPFLDYFPTGEMTKEKSNIYYLALSHLTVEQLNGAFISMIRNRVYKNFPQVAEIIQYATHTTEIELDDRVVLAKQMLKNTIVRYGSYGSVEFTDKGIHAVIDALDGWQKVCMMSADELEKFLTFEFAKIYKAYTRHNYPITERYIGFHDITNGTLNINRIDYVNMGKTLCDVEMRQISIRNETYKELLPQIDEQKKEIKRLNEIIEKNK